MAAKGGTWRKKGPRGGGGGFRGGSAADKMAGSPTQSERDVGRRVANRINNQSGERRKYDVNVLKTQYQSYSNTITRWAPEIRSGQGINGGGARSTQSAFSNQRAARVALRELGEL